MTTAIIGTGGIGSVIARQLASGGQALRLSSADTESARTLAAGIGHEGRSRVVAGGGALAMAFGTMSANLLESASNRSPEPGRL